MFLSTRGHRARCSFFPSNSGQEFLPSTRFDWPRAVARPGPTGRTNSALVKAESAFLFDDDAELSCQEQPTVAALNITVAPTAPVGQPAISGKRFFIKSVTLACGACAEWLIPAPLLYEVQHRHGPPPSRISGDRGDA